MTPTPTPVLGLGDTIAIAAGGSHTCALGTDRRVRCWGSNQYGQLGDGAWHDRDRTLVPSSSGSPAGLPDTIALAVGDEHTCALTVEGRVHCWGSNSDGQLGDGSRPSRSTPMPVTGLEDTIEIAAGGSHTCSLSADGRVHCWGANSVGQCGRDTNGWEARRPIPVPNPW